MQAIRPENLAPIVRASTTSLTLASTFGGQPTRVNIGGQQYTTTGMTLNTGSTGANGLDTGALSTNQLWYVYAIAHQTTFVMAMVASLATPTTGPSMPANYGTAYKLIGAFYTDSGSTVGSVVAGALGGTVQTEAMAWINQVTYTGFGTTSAEKVTMFRRGDKMIISGYFVSGTNSGTVALTLPGAFTMDLNKLLAATNIARVGLAFRINGNPAFASGVGLILFNDGSSTSAIFFNATAGTPAFAKSGALVNSGDGVQYEVEIPIVGWKTSLL